MNVRNLPLWITALALCATAFGQTTTTTTTSTYPPQFSFPPVGVAPTETAQINVANLASNSSSGTAASCTGTISFLDSAGATIGTAASFTVTSGQIFAAMLPFTSIGSSTRAEIRGLVQWTTSSSTAPCNLQSSFELFDTSSGVTHLVMGGAGGGPAGAPNGPGGAH